MVRLIDKNEVYFLKRFYCGCYICVCLKVRKYFDWLIFRIILIFLFRIDFFIFYYFRIYVKIVFEIFVFKCLV